MFLRLRFKFWRLRVLIGARGLVLLAGLALVVVGIVCLALSGAVVHGWWQGTLQAFGVGFSVGGVVDVLAISGLDQITNQGQGLRENNLEADLILGDPAPLTKAAAAKGLLIRSGGLIDPQLGWRRIRRRRGGLMDPQLGSKLIDLVTEAVAAGTLKPFDGFVGPPEETPGPYQPHRPPGDS